MKDLSSYVEYVRVGLGPYTVMRVKHPFAGMGDEGNGAFQVYKDHIHALNVIASNGEGWEHVSVSHYSRCPTWEEMCAVKDLFFDEDECVVQYHPAKQHYVNYHMFCLHMWKPTDVDLPTPPSIMVGTKVAP